MRLRIPIIVMLFDRGEGEEEMRGIIDYSGEKSFVSFITHAGNGSIVVAVTESGATAVKCLQTTTVISRIWDSDTVSLCAVQMLVLGYIVRLHCLLHM